MPNETWQSDFTHYRLTRPDGTPGADTEIITWLDDHSRYALAGQAPQLIRHDRPDRHERASLAALHDSRMAASGQTRSSVRRDARWMRDPIEA